MNIPELIHHLHNEGHPIFFYLLVMPFAKLSTNIFFMQLVCWISCFIAVFVLLKYAPFKIYTKLAVVLSAGFTYFLPVIARSYIIPETETTSDSLRNNPCFNCKYSCNNVGILCYFVRVFYERFNKR